MKSTSTNVATKKCMKCNYLMFIIGRLMVFTSVTMHSQILQEEFQFIEPQKENKVSIQQFISHITVI